MNYLLDHFNSTHVLDAPEITYRPLHIFREMIKRYQDQVQLKEKFLLFLHFEKYETCLQYCRTRELGTATFLMNEINKLKSDFPSCLKEGMESLYLAVVAYYEYAFLRYKSANEYLDLAIEKAKAQSKDFPLMTGSIGEQWLNKIRVYLKMKDTSLIIDETVKLFSFCLDGKYPDTEIAARYKGLGYDNHQLMINHVINTTCDGILALHKDSFQQADTFYKEIFSSPVLNAPADSLDSNTAAIIKLVALYYKDEKAFTDAIPGHFEALQKSPRFLKKAALLYYNRVMGKWGEDLSNHPNFENYKAVCDDLHIRIAIKEPAL